jgi:hypothetical protein
MGLVNIKGGHSWIHFYDGYRTFSYNRLTMARNGVVITAPTGWAFHFRSPGFDRLSRSADQASPHHSPGIYGPALLYALDEQVRRYEAEGVVNKYEFWEFLSAVLDDNQVCRGLTAMNLRSPEVQAFPADAIVIATGGVAHLREVDELSHLHRLCPAALYQQGVHMQTGNSCTPLQSPERTTD